MDTAAPNATSKPTFLDHPCGHPTGLHAHKLVTHLGAIMNGSSLCSDCYFQLTKSDFDQFADPLVYTIGDNEWTGCHRTNNGGYNPLERVAKVWSVLFSTPGRTLGQHPMRVNTQAAMGYPENVP